MNRDVKTWLKTELISSICVMLLENLMMASLIFQKCQKVEYVFFKYYDSKLRSSFAECFVADLCWEEETRSASWWLERVLLWWFKNPREYAVTRAPLKMLALSAHVSPSSFSTCSRVTGRISGKTLRQLGSCGSASCASTPRTSTSRSTSFASDSTPGSPPSTSSGRPNTLWLKVSLNDTLDEMKRKHGNMNDIYYCNHCMHVTTNDYCYIV